MEWLKLAVRSKMERILHVENEAAWRQIVRESLEDHHVDSAATVAEAIKLLGSTAPYDVALIDLNLQTDSDGQGGQILDLLIARYNSTRRIVITGNPPGGALRKNIFERYDAEEIIIKHYLDVPDLRRVVEEAVSLGPGGLSQALKLDRSSWRQRFRDWQRMQTNRIANEIRIAQEHVYDAARVSGQSKQRAEMAVAEAKKREQEFGARCDELRQLFNDIQNVDDLNVAVEALDLAEEEFGGGSVNKGE
jgi:CheY-like chemotaxis protein